MFIFFVFCTALQKGLQDNLEELEEVPFLNPQQEESIRAMMVAYNVIRLQEI